MPQAAKRWSISHNHTPSVRSLDRTESSFAPASQWLSALKAPPLLYMSGVPQVRFVLVSHTQRRSDTDANSNAPSVLNAANFGYPVDVFGRMSASPPIASPVLRRTRRTPHAWYTAMRSITE